ncbi:MAG: V-type ATP synthase subunit D [Clostridia bacterium]|nr:V-type ATP synthase subunit D [Clostridia bacterium]
MGMQLAPTKANLIKSKTMLQFSRKGYDLLDKKRNVLIREMMGLVQRANEIQNSIQSNFEAAFEALKFANITLGFNTVEELAISVPDMENFQVLNHSVMGVEVPEVRFEETPLHVTYGFYRTNAALDEAVEKFRKVRFLTYELAEIENAVYKLAMEIKKTQKRANALEKIQIPKYVQIVKTIEETLEEKEREDFFRLKKIKDKTKG